jgi:hypothetical protein
MLAKPYEISKLPVKIDVGQCYKTYEGQYDSRNAPNFWI